MGSRSWSRSGARAKENIRSVRPPESWGLAVGRARREWYELTGHDPSGSDYRDAAAAAILSLAVALWPQVAAEMAALDDPDGV
ncbi:MAG: hypothetical protein HY331_10835 [Chloroflexi bacterium]|nr:hypothetical protein [Chloroflexota bacterium]